MANRHFSEVNPERAHTGKGPGHPTGQKGPRKDDMPMKTAAWPGLPGPTQRRDRSGGTKKLKIHAKSEGI